jgi:hypothetical protein
MAGVRLGETLALDYMKGAPKPKGQRGKPPSLSIKRRDKLMTEELLRRRKLTRQSTTAVVKCASARMPSLCGRFGAEPLSRSGTSSY